MVFVYTSDVLKSMHIVLVSIPIVLVSVFWLSVLSTKCIGVTVLIPYVMMVFVVTVLQIFISSLQTDVVTLVLAFTLFHKSNAA